MSEPPDWYGAGRPHVWLPYAQMKTAPPSVPVARTEGSRIVLADGRELIDGIASWWTACHGYNHPHIRDAVRRQLEVMPHVMFGGLAHEPAYTLARRLAALLPGDLDHVFFAESGSVAVEVAMKMAVQYWLNRGVRGRTRFVAFRGGYHGDTMATMAVCDPEEGMHRLFSGLLPEHILVDLPRDEESAAAFERMLERHADELAGILVEPLVQGAGGMLFHDEAVLSRLRTAADRYDLLLIFDEIFTGFGRTGTMFACEQAGVVPDIVTLSKALTGGTLPLSAAVANGRGVRGVLVRRPAACPDAWADLHGQCARLRRRQCLARPVRSASRASRRSPPSRRRWRRAWSRAAVCPASATCGCSAASASSNSRPARRRQALRGAFLDEGVWVRPFGHIVYLTPAFTIDADDLARLTAAVRRVVERWSGTFGEPA